MPAPLIVSNYKGELLRYQQETEKFSNVWTKRARNERFARYWQAMHTSLIAKEAVKFINHHESEMPINSWHMYAEVEKIRL